MSERMRKPWGEQPPPDPHVWNTLGYRGVEQADGRCVIEWDAPPEYCFHAPSGPIVHGGMVAALLDTAMGGACWTMVTDEEDFLTADLRTEFHRSARPGTLRAEGHVVQRNRRVVFCGAELYQDDELDRELALHADRAPLQLTLADMSGVRHRTCLKQTGCGSTMLHLGLTFSHLAN